MKSNNSSITEHALRLLVSVPIDDQAEEFIYQNFCDQGFRCGIIEVGSNLFLDARALEKCNPTAVTQP